MTVEQLIKILKTCPKNMEVVIGVCEESLTSLSEEDVDTVEFYRNVNSHDWTGEHKVATKQLLNKYKNKPVEKGLCIRR